MRICLRALAAVAATLLVSFAILFAASFPVLADTPPTWSGEALAEKSAVARGGLDALRAIHTLVRSGTLLVNGGSLKLNIVQTLKRGPNGPMIRAEATLQGLTVTQAWDGTEGWQINPFQGRKDAERTPRDDNKALIEDADIGGPLIDWQAKKYKLAYAGVEDVDGTPALKVKVSKPDGDVVMVYLDPDYFLEIRTISQRTEHGVPIETQADFGDYEKVSGVYFPFAIESGKRGSTETQKIQFDKGEANLEVADDKFQFPTRASNAAAPKASKQTPKEAAKQ